jgi:hypothetical protein
VISDKTLTLFCSPCPNFDNLHKLRFIFNDKKHQMVDLPVTVHNSHRRWLDPRQMSFCPYDCLPFLPSRDCLAHTHDTACTPRLTYPRHGPRRIWGRHVALGRLACRSGNYSDNGFVDSRRYHGSTCRRCDLSPCPSPTVPSSWAQAGRPLQHLVGTTCPGWTHAEAGKNTPQEIWSSSQSRSE